MKVFECGHCHHAVFFENYACETCGHLSGFSSIGRRMLTFDPSQDKLLSDREHNEYKYCKNREYDVCNWVIKKDDPREYCDACQLNRKIPNLSDKDNFEKWQNLEIAKHRLVYQLAKMGLDLPSKMEDPNGLCFDFVAKQGDPNLMTGHASGVITILLQEADSVWRERMRKKFLEPYRTLIGHLRHEVGHYFWDRLVFSDASTLAEFRSIFGNEELDYGDSLQQYYKVGAPVGWERSYISKYATAHPWEDWAETWAHYLHIMAMVETAYFFGVTVDDRLKGADMRAKVTFDPYLESDFDNIIRTCVPLSLAVNSINRAMGLPDVYPFVIVPAVVEKLKFIHRLLLPKR